MRAGETRVLRARLGRAAAARDLRRGARARLDGPRDYWREWLSRGRFPDHPWRIHLQRSALTLKGLTYAPTGALVAAATTSLPETPGGERNWDYRYTWLRDSTFTLWGLYTLGFDCEANDYFYFITDRLEATGDAADHVRHRRRDASSTSGRSTTSPATRAPGRSASATARGDQRQHDVWGVLLDSVCLHTRSGDRLDDRLWPLLARAGRDGARALARAGPRHLGGARRARSTSPRRRSCAGSPPIAARAWPRMRGDDDRAERWQAAADEIHADVCEHGVDDRGVFVQHYDTDALDASLLLDPARRLPAAGRPARPRDRARDRRRADRGRAGPALPGRRDRRRARGEEGTFTICSFWLVSALAEIGELDRARALCEKLLSYASPLLLYAEEIDPHTGRHLGNFPQAFTHLALINAVMHIVGPTRC